MSLGDFFFFILGGFFPSFFLCLCVCVICTNKRMAGREATVFWICICRILPSSARLLGAADAASFSLQVLFVNNTWSTTMHARMEKPERGCTRPVGLVVSCDRPV
ncbi:hypothetical protein LY76DRAFT_121458 [Colletotrichum caudatum]|nr:hypothetical protein LY76DRAFT_121458 [Colletotrichum caudatum]